MKISTCIHKLLLENEIVIIPGFGAFISQYKPAEINPENDEIKPPSKELSFNQKIRNNDGLLVGYFAEKKGISHFDALREIEKERENIIYQLDKGEKITFENVGILFRNPDNEIEFESFQQENLLIDSFGLEATSLTPSETEIETEVEDEKHEEQEIPVSGGENEITEPETEPEIISDKEMEEPQETIHEPTTFVKEQLVFGVYKPAGPGEEENKKKKRGWLWLFLIFIPIIIAGYFLYNRNVAPPQIQKERPVQKKEAVESNKNLLPDSTKLDSTQQETSETLQPDQTSTIENMNQGNYYLVGGSFKEEENAEKFLEEFNAEGYTPFKLGKRGNFYIIAIGRYNTEKEAVTAQNQFMDKNPDSGTWVYKDETK